MNKLFNWFKRYQLAAFFIITFVITWGLGFSYGAVLKRGQYLLAPPVFYSDLRPRAGGDLISAVTNT